MRFIKPLLKPEIATLREMHHQHPLAWTRQRAQAILLNAKGYSVQDIATIRGLSPNGVELAAGVGGEGVSGFDG